MERFVMICSLSFVFSGAPGAAGNDPYALGVACFERLDFSCAIDLLSAAASVCPRKNKTQLVDIYRKLAVSQLALGRRPEAVADFVRLLRVAPDFRLDQPGISPKILDAFSEARIEIEKTSSSRQAPKPAPRQAAPESPAWLELGLTTGAELLVGEDRRLLDVGPAVDLECNFIVRGPWRVGAGLRYTFHGLSAGNDSLQLGGGWVSAGLDWRLGPLAIAVQTGLGAVYFGIPGNEGRAGLWLPLRLGAGYSLGRGLQLGVVITPAWIVTFDGGAKSSFTLALGGRLLLTL